MKNKEQTELLAKELASLTNPELVAEAKKLKSFSVTHAFIIGFLIGILVYSFVQHTWGLLALIPLYLIYKFANDSRNTRLTVLKKLLKERNLE